MSNANPNARNHNRSSSTCATEEPASKGAPTSFTVNLADRSSRLLVDRVEDLRASVGLVKSRHPFDVVAWVALPDHLHAVWTLPADDADFSTRWMLIKAGFSRRIESSTSGERVSPSRRSKGERAVWRRRFWEHRIGDDDDLERHIAYVHINPVKHGHAARAADWPYSSIHRYIRAGLLPPDWAAVDSIELGGERD